MADKCIYAFQNTKEQIENEVFPAIPLAVDTVRLKQILCCGRKTAVEIGTMANARVQIGRRLLWNVKQIQQYLDDIAE